MMFGDVDGFGSHGVLSVVRAGEGVVCHECGLVLRALGTHLRSAHAITVESYRAAHGLPPTTSLVAPATHHRRYADRRTLLGDGPSPATGVAAASG